MNTILDIKKSWEKCIGMRLTPDNSKLYIILYTESKTSKYSMNEIRVEEYSTSRMKRNNVTYFHPAYDINSTYGSADICVTDSNTLLYLKDWTSRIIHLYNLKTAEEIIVYDTKTLEIKWEPDKVHDPVLRTTIFSRKSLYYAYYKTALTPGYKEVYTLTHYMLNRPGHEKTVNVPSLSIHNIYISNDGQVIIGVHRYNKPPGISIWRVSDDKLEVIEYSHSINSIAFSSDDKYVAIVRESNKYGYSILYIYGIDNIHIPVSSYDTTYYWQNVVTSQFEYIDTLRYILVYSNGNELNEYVHIDMSDNSYNSMTHRSDCPISITYNGTTSASIEGSVLKIVSRDDKPFKSHTFYKHQINIQKLAIYTFMLADKLIEERQDLPQLPVEILLLIISLFAKSDSIKKI